jgi:hypothetical protein
METPHYHVRRLRSEEYDAEIDIPSYEVELVEEEEEEPRHHGRPAPLPQAEKAAVRDIAHTAPPPPTPAKAETGFFGRLLKSLFGGGKAETVAPASPVRAPRPPQARGPHPQRRPEHRDHREHRGPRPPHRGGQQPRPQQGTGRAEGRPEGRPQPPARTEGRPEPRPQTVGGERPQQPQAPVAKDQSDRPERPEGASGRRRRRGRRGRGTARPQQEGTVPRPEGQITSGESQEMNHAPEAERGNEALPSSERRWEEPPQARTESTAAPMSVVHEQPAAVPVQTAMAESAPIQAEPQPLASEPKNP